MADIDPKWSLNLDKVAYGVGGALALIVVFVALFLAPAPDEAGLTEAADAFNSAYNRVKNELRNSPLEVVSLDEVLQKQWDPGTACPVNPKWITERAPALLRKVPAAVTSKPQHEKGTITEINIGRDSKRKRPYLVIRGAPGEGRYVVLKSVTLLKKGGDGDFQPVKEFSATSEFEFQDYDIVPGMTYTYKLVTEAERDPAAPSDLVEALPPEEARKESDEVGPTPPVPFDYKLTLVSVEKLTDPTQKPGFFARMSYWDYEKNELVQVNRGSLQKFTEGQRVGENVDGSGRYEFLTVDDLNQTVIVVDRLRNTREEIKKDPKADRPVGLWPNPVKPASEEAPPEKEEAPKEEKKEPAKKAEAPPKTPPPKTPAKPPAGKTSKTTPEKKPSTQKKFR